MLSFCLLANQRCGTHYLAESLNAHPDVAVVPQHRWFCPEVRPGTFYGEWLSLVLKDPEQSELPMVGRRVFDVFLAGLAAEVGGRATHVGVAADGRECMAFGRSLESMRARGMAIVHLVRSDPQTGVLASWLAQRERAGVGGELSCSSSPNLSSPDEEGFVRETLRRLEADRELEREFAGVNAYLRVDYRELADTSRPAACLRRVLGFIGAGAGASWCEAQSVPADPLLEASVGDPAGLLAALERAGVSPGRGDRPGRGRVGLRRRERALGCFGWAGP